MRALRGAIAVAAVLAAGSAWAASDDNAKARGGGSAGSASVGAQHHSGSSGSSVHSSSSTSSSQSGGSGSSYTPTAAQLRHPRAGTGTGFRDHRFGGGSYWYDPYWSSWYGGWYGWYGWYRPYGYYSPYYYSGFYGYQPYPHRYGYSAYAQGSVRVLVEPSQTRVYVDGYYAGIADDFDGLFQRLRVAPGRHDIDLKLEGYRTFRVKLYVPYDQTIKIHHDMVRGTGEEVGEVVGRPEDVARYDARRDEPQADDDDQGEYDDRDREADRSGERGVVRLDIRPGDASVYVDGAFRGTGRELRQLRLTPGRHRLEVVRPGYRTVDREVEVRRGETSDVQIDLDRS